VDLRLYLHFDIAIDKDSLPSSRKKLYDMQFNAAQMPLHSLLTYMVVEESFLNVPIARLGSALLLSLALSDCQTYHAMAAATTNVKLWPCDLILRSR